MIAVATPSRFKSKEVAYPDTIVKPVINAIGATTPPAEIAPASHGRSFFSNGGAFDEAFTETTFLTVVNKKRPMKAPKYRKPAKATGGTSVTNNFAIVGLMPKSAAESIR